MTQHREINTAGDVVVRVCFKGFTVIAYSFGGDPAAYKDATRAVRAAVHLP